MSKKEEIIGMFEDLLERAERIVKRNENKKRFNDILAKINGVLVSMLKTFRDNNFSLPEQQIKHFSDQLDEYQKELHKFVEGYDKFLSIIENL